ACATLLEAARNPHRYFAIRLKESMSSGLTGRVNQQDLIRLVLSRSEIDLREISQTFSKDAEIGQRKSLLQWIKDSTSGHLCMLLQGLTTGDKDSVVIVEESESKTAENSALTAMADRMNSGNTPTSPTTSTIPTTTTTATIYGIGVDEACVFANPAFDAVQAAQRVDQAFKSNDANKAETAIVDILSKCSNAQRLQLKKRLLSEHKIDMFDYITKRLFKNNRQCTDSLLALLMSTDEYDAYQIYQAWEKNDVEIVIDIVCAREQEQLRKIRTTYSTVYGKDLCAVTSDKCSRRQNVGNMLNAIINLERDTSTHVEASLVNQDIEWLTDKKNKLAGKDKDQFVMLFAKRSWSHIRALNSNFELKASTTLEQLIIKNLGKKVSGYCLLTILKYCINRPDMFAEKLKEAFKTKNLSAIERIIISRGEIDLYTIRTVFAQNQHGGGKTLELKLKELLTKSNEMYLDILINLVTYADQIKSASNVTAGVSPSGDTSIINRGTVIADDTVSGVMTSLPSSGTEKESSGNTTANPDDKGTLDSSGYFLISGDALVGVDFAKFGMFLKNVINEKTADKVWGKLADSEGFVVKGKMVELLNFSAMLMIAYVEKKKGKISYTQDKARMKKCMEPLIDWLTDTKLPKGKISKWDYIGKLGDWVNEVTTFFFFSFRE
ncbi:hypothetical protein RFI_05702, partial [Reticulomyxa filosa]